MVMTARDLITEAMRELKVLPSGGEPEAEELRDGLTRLRAMLASWQTTANQWRDVTTTVTAAALTASVPLPADVRTVAAVRDVTSYQRPLIVWDRDDYNLIPNKDQVGRPLAYVEQRGRDATSLILWPLPPVDLTLSVDYQRRFDQIANESAEIDVPDDWLEAVWTNLAVRMAGMFGSAAELTPELVARAATLLDKLQDDDRPDSYYMGSERYA